MTLIVGLSVHRNFPITNGWFVCVNVLLKTQLLI
jgi:hypothetical protein